MSKTYQISWVKNYFATGEELIEAESEEEAIEIAQANIGDYEGSMQYSGDDDWVECHGEIKAKGK